MHLLEPSPTGRLAGHEDVVLNEADKQLLLKYQKDVAQDDSLPILSCFLYLESPQAFGCGAGLTHLYIDGSGEVCPCNFVPLSFGNISREPLIRILDRMGCFFCKPRPSCVGKVLSGYIQSERLPLGPDASAEICRQHLPSVHPIPRYFQIRSQAGEEVGNKELQFAYDQIHQDYDEFWLKEAAKPIVDLVARIPFTKIENVFEAGCGTGFATVLIAKKFKDSLHITAVDISEGMLAQAHKRVDERDSTMFVLLPVMRSIFSAAQGRLIWSSRAGYWDIYLWSLFLPLPAVLFENLVLLRLLFTRKIPHENRLRYSAGLSPRTRPCCRSGWRLTFRAI